MSGAVNVQSAVLAHLREDATVQATFGHPARLIDADSEAAAFPFARLEAHEMSEAGASGVDASEHRLTLAVHVREGGLAAAKAAVDVLRDSLQAATGDGLGLALVLLQVTYCDVTRAPDRRAYRGLLRIRMITEEGAP